MERVYLDHAGATLPSTAQMSDIAANLASDVLRLGNPHSRHASGQTSHAIVRNVRDRLLTLFGVSSNEYAVVFTKNTTDSLQIATEIADLHFVAAAKTSKTLLLCRDSHTSVHGLRHRLPNWKVSVSDNDSISSILPGTKCDLFLFTAMSNFCGRKYDVNILKQIKDANPHALICVDLAALAGTSPVDLKRFGLPEFVALSFYKIFGYPTGIGALLVRKGCGFRPRSFAGGNVDFYDVDSGEFQLKPDLDDMFENGTPNYHGIDLLRYGFDDLERFGGLPAIQKHAFSFALAARKFLTETKHANGAPIAVVYGWNDVNFGAQGPIVNFNLLRDDGSFVGYVEVEKMCELFVIELRTGCFCNRGACRKHLDLPDAWSGVDQGKRCGDEMDLLDGRPLGSCRISFGRTSTQNDLDAFKRMVETCFISSPHFSTNLKQDVVSVRPNRGRLTNLAFYPVKSCSGVDVKRWRLTESGLWLDRQWMVVTRDGVVLTQKRLPALCTIATEISENHTLLLADKFTNSLTVEVGLDPPATAMCEKASVCINNSTAIDCGPEYSTWLEDLHPNMPSGVRLLRILSPNCADGEQTETFNNKADYLLITWASVCAVAKEVGLEPRTVMRRFRANFVIDTLTDIPFDEDNFREVVIGGVPFEVTARCTRCQMIAIDQDTGEKDPNVLIALRNVRCGDRVTFGVYLQRTTNTVAELAVGSNVLIKRHKAE